MRRFVTFALVVGIGLAGNQTYAAEHTKDSPETVKKALAEKKAILVDVREQAEWNEGHLQGALLLPLSKLDENDIKNLVKDLPKDKPIYAHCKAGGRCLRAAEILQKLGYDVRPLKQGYQELLEAGLPKDGK